MTDTTTCLFSCKLIQSWSFNTCEKQFDLEKIILLIIF